MIEQTTYYRPEWTCGRYNKEKQIALMYNLIEGMSYLFEDYSAEVVGEILKVSKNESVSIDKMSLRTLIDKEDLVPFFAELIALGLLTHEIPTKQIIDEYQKRVGRRRREKPQDIKRATHKELSQEISGAEKDYFDRVGGVSNVMFELTYNCSEKCIHCYNPGAIRNDSEISERKNRIELNLDDYKRIIDELYDLGLAKVHLTGGDPFSKPEVWEIIDYLYHKDIAIDIFTNGQSIVKDIQRLVNYYPCVVGISIYSGIAEEHDYITRIKGSWERSINVVKQLSDFGVPTILKCCILRTNIKSYHLVKNIAMQYGAIFQFDVRISNSIEGDKCVSRYLRLTPDLLELVLLDGNVNFTIVGKPNYDKQEKLRNPSCKGYCITPEGNVQLCCIFPSSFGNLKIESFSDILRHSKDLLYWQNIKLKDFSECGKNDYCNFCFICPGINFIETGNPLKPSATNCEIAKIRFELAEKLKQGIDLLNGKTLQEYLETVSIPLLDLRREYELNYRDKKLLIGG
jgi:MoaA/NifB/PqqE/SkfB family radical SAM enzyme